MEASLHRNVDDAIKEISSYFVGSDQVTRKILSAIFSSGHILIEDFPGTGKTFLAKLLSRVLGISYRRVQFTPDLLPSDIIGTKIWRPQLSVFETYRGPIFSNLILADEINRAPPKTQAALLEAMEERQVTIEGDTVQLPSPFIVIATENPIEFEGTYPLPEAQLDRFMLQLSLGYPGVEKDLLRRRLGWKTDDPSSLAKSILSPDIVIKIRDFIESSVVVSDEVLDYLASFKSIRGDDRILAGPSPRAIISLMRMARGYAFVSGRSYVIPDDVKIVAKDVLSHRIVLKPELEMENISTTSIIEEYIGRLPVKK